MINVILWSKDRAAQLDLTLQTYKKHFKEWESQSLNIIYKVSNDQYNDGYNMVKLLHPEFNFVKETNFRTNTLDMIFSSKKEYTAFLVDDDVFIDDFTLESKEFKEFDDNPLIATISPRMGRNINYCYTENRPAKQPIINEKNMWKWRENCSGDWSYPFSVAAFNIFRKNDLNPLPNIPFRATNTFEAAMCNIPFSARDWMICFDTPKTFTGANNRVQVENLNRTENCNSIDSLNTEFLSGKRLDADVNYKLQCNSCHGKVNYIWN